MESSKIFNSAEYRTRIVHEFFYGELTLGEQIKIFFPFKQPNEFCDIPLEQMASKIVDHDLPCSCVDNLIIRPDGIEANFNTNQATTWGKARSVYYTSIKIFFEDDQKLKVPNNIGALVYNPDKAQVTLEVYGTLRMP